MSLSSLAFRFKADVPESQRVVDLLRCEIEKAGLRHTESFEAGTDVVVAVGGDGTVLSAIRDMGGLRESIPILALHTGKGRGFLHPQAAPKEPALLETWCRELATSLATGAYRLTSRWGLEGRLADKPEGLWALNDFVISKGLLSRLVMLRIDVFDVYGETLFSKMRGDGLIVSSSLGSTAYSFSAGGPVVHPRLKNLVLTPICPVDHPGRSIILSGDARIQVTIHRDRGPAHLTLDGQLGFEMPEATTIEVGSSRKPVRWVKPILESQPNRGYFEQLQTKLGFGGIEGGGHAS